MIAKRLRPRRILVRLDRGRKARIRNAFVSKNSKKAPPHSDNPAIAGDAGEKRGYQCLYFQGGRNRFRDKKVKSNTLEFEHNIYDFIDVLKLQVFSSHIVVVKESTAR